MVGTIDQLIEQLTEARERLGGDAGVRVAYQPGYPMRGTLAAVTVPPSEHPYDEGGTAPGQDGDGSMLWLAVGSAPWEESPYGPAWAWGESEYA